MITAMCDSDVASVCSSLESEAAHLDEEGWVEGDDDVADDEVAEDAKGAEDEDMRMSAGTHITPGVGHGYFSLTDITIILTAGCPY